MILAPLSGDQQVACSRSCRRKKRKFEMERPSRKRARVPGSRRDLREKKKEAQEKRFKASVEPIRDFFATHVGDEELKRVVEQGFHECGEVILGHLRDLYGPDPSGDVAAAEQGKLLVQMGLISPEKFASSFGGAMSVLKPLDELRGLAVCAGINAYSKKNEAGGRQNLTHERLLEECMPLIYVSPQIYRDAHNLNAPRMLQRLRELECVPGEDEVVERELNRRICAYSVPRGRLPPSYFFYTLDLPQRFIAEGPIAYRPSLAKHASDLWHDFKNQPRIDDQVAFAGDTVRRHMDAEESIRHDIRQPFNPPRRVWTLHR